MIVNEILNTKIIVSTENIISAGKKKKIKDSVTK